MDKWSEWLLGSYDESYRNAEQFFEQLYAAHDANKDNVLDFSEFSNVCVASQLVDDVSVLFFCAFVLSCFCNVFLVFFLCGALLLRRAAADQQRCTGREFIRFSFFLACLLAFFLCDSLRGGR